MGLEELPFLLLPRDYREKLPDFYKRGGREKVERFARKVEAKYQTKFRPLIWIDNQGGLRSVSNSPSSGLDLNGHMFGYHNIFDKEFAMPLFRVVRFYISLLKNSK